MDKTQIINNIFGVARKRDDVELAGGNRNDPVELEIEQGKKVGVLYELKSEIRDDPHLEKDVMNEIPMNVIRKENGNVVFSFPELTRADYNGERYELGSRGVSVTTEAIEEEMMG